VLASSEHHAQNRDTIGNLQSDAAGGDNCIECELAPKDQHAGQEVENSDSHHGPQRHGEMLVDGCKIRRKGECSILGHGPGKSGTGRIDVHDDEILIWLSVCCLFIPVLQPTFKPIIITAHHIPPPYVESKTSMNHACA